ncbi:MAG: hypothetical protein WAU58_18440 [Terriglobales bacterium]
MDQTFFPSIIAAASGLIGSLIGGGLTLLSSSFTNRAAEKQLETKLTHEREQNRQELLRARGEELYTITSAWLKMIGTYQMRGMAVLYGTITHSQAIDQQLADGKPNYDFDRIEMLMDAYFPSVTTAYEAVLSERDRFASMHSDFNHKYRQVGSSARNTQTVTAHEKSATMTEALGNELKKRIVKALRDIEN